MIDCGSWVEFINGNVEISPVRVIFMRDCMCAGISCDDSHTAIILMLLLAGCSIFITTVLSRVCFFPAGATRTKKSAKHTRAQKMCSATIHHRFNIFMARAENCYFVAPLCDLSSRAICKLKRCSPKNTCFTSLYIVARAAAVTKCKRAAYYATFPLICMYDALRRTLFGAWRWWIS